MRYIALYLLGFLLAAVIHLDWHFALPGHHEYALAWSQYWILPALSFFAVGLIIARAWPRHALRYATYALLIGLVLGQLFVPALTMLLEEGRLGFPTDASWWRGFPITMAAGLPALYAAAWFLRPRAARMRAMNAA